MSPSAETASGDDVEVPNNKSRVTVVGSGNWGSVAAKLVASNTLKLSSFHVTTKINRDLLRLAKGCGLADSLLTIPSAERDAPTILGYDTTYGGRIRAKAVAKPSEELPEALRPSKERPFRGSLRLPTETEPFETEETMPPRSIQDMLQKRLEEKEKKKNLAKGGSFGASGSATVLPPSLSQKRPPPTSTPTEDTPASAGKRVKTHATKSGTGGGKARMEELEREPEGARAKGKGAASEAVWTPNFITPDKKQVLKSDSLKEDPSLAFTLHAGLMLPKDTAPPPSLKAAISEYYFHVGRATQSIMSAQRYLTEHDKQAKLLKQKVVVCQNSAEDYKKSLEQSEDARRSLEVDIANLNDLVKGLQDGAEQTRAEGKDEGLQEGRALGRKEMEEEMKKFLQGEYDRGYAQAEDDAVDQLMALQAGMKEAQHKKSFTLGFNAGLDEAGVEPADELRDLLVVPPLPVDEDEAEEPPLAEPIENPTEQPVAETTPAPAEPQSSSATLSTEA